MYGMIHAAARDMVRRSHGEALWNDIVAGAGLTDDAFLSMKSYDDSVMGTLLTEIVAHTGMTLESCLDNLGVHWILETANQHYKILLDSYGPDLWSLFRNLDHMHDRISSSMPAFNAPSFRLESVSANEHKLYYHSARQGLTPFVQGLLKGLAIKYGRSLHVSVISEERSAQGQQTVFAIRDVTAS